MKGIFQPAIRWRQWVCYLFFWLWILFGALAYSYGQHPPASAADTLQAKECYEKARKLRKSGLYQEALQALDETIDFCNARSLWKPLALAYWEKAYMHFNQAELDSVFRPLSLLDSIARTHADSVLVAESLKMKGNLFHTLARHTEALSMHREALEWGNESQDAHTFNELARDYFAMGKTDSAAFCINQSINYKKRLEDLYGLAVTYGNAGHLYNAINQEDMAMTYFDSSLTIAQTHRFYDLQAWMHKSLSDLFAADREFEQALDHYRWYNRYQDSARAQPAGMDFVMEKVKSASAIQHQQIRQQQSALNRTTLFLYLFIILFVLAILILWVVRLSMKKRQAELRQQLSRLQMNPHFIFNSLNSLQKFILENDIRASNKYLTRFSSLMRTTLENSYHDSVVLRDELEHLKVYLELESMRFDQKFQYRIMVDDAILPNTVKIPSLLIQPFVENAIWHGLLHKESGERNLLIRFFLRKKILICEVEDNGIGRLKAMEIKSRQEKQQTSLGTTITEQRLSLLQLIYKRKFSVIYHDLRDSFGNPSGTRVDIIIPVTN